MTTRESNAEPVALLSANELVDGRQHWLAQPATYERGFVLRLLAEHASLREQLTAATARATELERALALAEVDVSLERSWCRMCRTEDRSRSRGRAGHSHAAECLLAAQHQSAPSEREARVCSECRASEGRCECSYCATCEGCVVNERCINAPDLVPAPKPAEATGAELPGDPGYYCDDCELSRDECAAQGCPIPEPTPAEATASEHPVDADSVGFARLLGPRSSEPPSATPRVDAGVLYQEPCAVCGHRFEDHGIAAQGHGACAGGCACQEWSPKCGLPFARCAELERRARELCERWVAGAAEALRPAHDVRFPLAVRARAFAKERCASQLAELLETGTTKGSGDGKE